MNKVLEYLSDNGYKDCIDYWQKGNTYVQFDDVIVRVTIGEEYRDIPIDIVNAFPAQLSSTIELMGGK